eukprot:1733706-Amphidinium_carterae.1
MSAWGKPSLSTCDWHEQLFVGCFMRAESARLSLAIPRSQNACSVLLWHIPPARRRNPHSQHGWEKVHINKKPEQDTQSAMD